MALTRYFEQKLVSDMNHGMTLKINETAMDEELNEDVASRHRLTRSA